MREFFSHETENEIMFGTCCLIKNSIKNYIEKLVAKTKPRKVLVCMIYYLDENNVPSWANTALGALGYNSDPERLQLLIRKVFEKVTR